MTSRTNNDATIRVGADIRGALGQLRRLEDHARGTARKLNNVTGGLLGGGARAGAGGLGRAGSILTASAGLGAGLAIVEKLFETLFSRFEETPLLEKMTSALGTMLDAVVPLAGIIIESLTPVLKELTPLIGPIAEAFAPLAQLLGGALATALKIITPLLIPLIKAIGIFVQAARDAVFFILDKIVGGINRVLGTNIELPDLPRSGFGDVNAQLNSQLAAVATEVEAADHSESRARFAQRQRDADAARRRRLADLRRLSQQRANAAAERQRLADADANSARSRVLAQQAQIAGSIVVQVNVGERAIERTVRTVTQRSGLEGTE